MKLSLLPLALTALLLTFSSSSLLQGTSAQPAKTSDASDLPGTAADREEFCGKCKACWKCLRGEKRNRSVSECVQDRIRELVERAEEDRAGGVRVRRANKIERDRLPAGKRILESL
jgi:hypothetical protein